MSNTNLLLSKILGFPAQLICEYSHPTIRTNLSKATRVFLSSLENYNYDFAHNGELRVMNLLKSKSIRTVFDVGANIGEWAVLANENLSPNNLFAFEIAPEAFSFLQNRISSFANIKTHNIGMSDRVGEVTIFLGKGKASAFTSLYPITDSENSSAATICCQVTTIDKFCLENFVTTIDWLKIDTEGHDFKVILGASQMLKNKKVRFVQFEYGKASILTKDLLKDFYEFFHSIDYKVGKYIQNM